MGKVERGVAFAEVVRVSAALGHTRHRNRLQFRLIPDASRAEHDQHHDGG